MEFQKLTFVVIFGAVRERIKRDFELGTVQRETFCYREGQIGLIIPRFAKKWGLYRANPCGRANLLHLPVMDICCGVDGAGEEGDIAIVVSRFPDLIPQKKDDYRIIMLSRDEFVVVEGRDKREIARNIKIIRVEKKIDSPGDGSTKREIRDLLLSLEWADCLFLNPLSIVLEPATRCISESTFKAVEFQHQALMAEARLRA